MQHTAIGQNTEGNPFKILAVQKTKISFANPPTFHKDKIGGNFTVAQRDSLASYVKELINF